MPPKKNYSPLRTVTLTRWTPEEIDLAIRVAEGGDFGRMSKHVITIMRNIRVSAALKFRVGSILALSVDGGEYKGSRILNALFGENGDFWRMFPEHTLHALVAWGEFMNMGLVEYKWTFFEDVQRWIPVLRVWDNTQLRYDWERRRYKMFVGEETETKSGQVSKVTAKWIDLDFEGDKWALYTPMGADTPWRWGLYYGLAEEYLLNQFGRNDLGRYSEIHGQGIKKAWVPKGTKQTRKDEMKRQLEDLSTDAAIILERDTTTGNAETDLELLEAKARTWEVFQFEMEWFALSASIGILGANLLQNVESGSLAAAQVHKAMFESGVTKGDAKRLSTFLQQGPLSWWLYYNIDQLKPAPFPRFYSPEDEHEMLLKQAERQERAGSAARVWQELSGGRLDVEAYAKQNGVPLLPASGQASSGSTSEGSPMSDQSQ